MATISCHHARALIAQVVAHGHSKDELLIHAKINPLLLDKPNARINESQMNSLVKRAHELFQDEFIGFTRAPSKTGVFAMMTEVVRRCESLREALLMGVQFYNLFTDDISTELIEENNEAVIRVSLRQPELDPDYFFLEFWMVMWHRLSSWMIGTRIILLEARFIHDEPKHVAELAYLFPSPQRFRQCANELRFNVDYLALPLIRDRKAWNEFLTNAPYDFLSIPGDDQSLQNKITVIIKKASTDKLCFPPVKEVAEQLNLSSQTLHRRLKDEATSYQRIKDNIRRDTAMIKLIQEKLPVHKVAELVGFSDSRSFTRAFKQWTGLSPREYCKFI